MPNSTGDRFNSEGEWREVDGMGLLSLKEDGEALLSTFLRAEHLRDSGNIHVPRSLRPPAPDFTGVERVGNGPFITIVRWDPKSGLLDFIGYVNAKNVEDGPLGLLLTLEPTDEGTYLLWGAPAFVP